MEGETKKHKMVVPKGPISDDMWRTISRGIDEIEEICEKAEEIYMFQKMIHIKKQICMMRLQHGGHY